MKIVLQVLLALTFIISGFSKLFPIETFELLIVNQGFFNWHTVPFVSRFLIIIEIFLGFALLQKSFYRKIFLPSAALLLLFFSIHLTYSIMTKTGGGNCGCFGELIPMTSLEALIKNIILIGVSYYIYKEYKEPDTSRKPALFLMLLLSIFVVILIAPYKQYTLYKEEVEEEVVRKEIENYDIEKDAISEDNLAKNMDVIDNVEKKSRDTIREDETVRIVKYRSVFNKFVEFSNNVKVNLDEGKKLVAMFSLDCEHCMELGKKISEYRKTHKFPEVYVLFFGDEGQIPEFFTKVGESYPFIVLKAQEFFPLIGATPPRLTFLDNGKILGDWLTDFDFEEVVKVVQGE